MEVNNLPGAWRVVWRGGLNREDSSLEEQLSLYVNLPIFLPETINGAAITERKLAVSTRQKAKTSGLLVQPREIHRFFEASIEKVRGLLNPKDPALVLVRDNSSR